MGASQRLRLDRVRGVFHLLDEVRDLGDDPPAWHEHMLRGLAGLTGARVALGGTLLGVGEAPLEPHPVTELGWAGPREQAAYYDWLARREYEHDPLDRIFRPDCRQTQTVDSTRECHTFGSCGTGGYEYRRRAGVEHYVMSVTPVPGHEHAVHAFALLRPFGEPTFTPTERGLVQLFHEELARVWRSAESTVVRTVPVARLPRRLSQTLSLLRAGASEKQVALRLGLSAHTAHDYLKALHKRFGVSSRGELLAAAAPPPPLRSSRVPMLAAEWLSRRRTDPPARKPQSEPRRVAFIAAPGQN
jgi:DNA-binding CsgD family transcriptional regulator